MSLVFQNIFALKQFTVTVYSHGSSCKMYYLMNNRIPCDCFAQCIYDYYNLVISYYTLFQCHFFVVIGIYVFCAYPTKINKVC